MHEPQTRYINPTICASPILPPNAEVVFPDTLRRSIDIFQDMTQDKRVRANSQHQVERYLVERGSCSSMNPVIMDDFRLRLFSIDSNKLDAELATTRSLDASIHDNLACAVDAIIYNDKVPGTFSPSQRERIRNWFPTIKQIGAESVEGYALKTSFTPTGNLFVMKTPRSLEKDELVHEALVGFYALNKLRHILPNYMYVYGFVYCSAPAIERKEVATWCSSSGHSVSYLITENIQNAMPIGEFIVDPNTAPLDFLTVFYQLINALNLAYKSYGYTHYDLHTGNIMIRKYSQIIAIPFLGTNNQINGYIATSNVPYIIDYGYSRITVGGIGFGKVGLEGAGIEGQRPFAMYDTYKILGFLGEKLYTKPRTIHYAPMAVLLEKLFSFFGEGTLLSRVERRLNAKRDWYGAPEQYRNLDHDDYITWLRNQVDIENPIFTNLSMIPGVYTAPINTSMDTCTFYQMMGSNNGPATSLEYCEVVGAINADTVLDPYGKQQAVSWLNTHFDAEKYFTNTLPTVNEKIQEVNDLRAHTNIPNLLTVTNAAYPEFVNSYRNSILDLLKIKDLTADTISYTRASICSLISQGTYQKFSTQINALSTMTTEWVQFINQQRTILQNNVDYAKTVDWSTRTHDKQVLAFYRTEHEVLVFAD
jgi:hypothetical protein